LTGANQVAAWTIGTTLSILDDAQIVGGAGFDSRLIPYEETINDAVIWGLPIDPKRGLIFCDVADIAANFTGLITATGFPEINLVDLDLDSRIRLGFTADDKPTILLQSGAYYSLIQESQAEGLAGADLRIGLDESNRTMIICDRGDINTDLNLPSHPNPTICIYNAALTSRLNINCNSFVASSDFYIIVTSGVVNFKIDNDRNSGDAFIFWSGPNDELTDTDAEQAFMYLEPKVKQTATAAFDALHVDLFAGNTYGDGSTGDGNNFIRLTDNGVAKFRTSLYGYVKAGTLSAALADNDTFTTTIPDSWTGIVIVENTTDTTSGVYHLDGTTLAVINQNAGFTTAQGTNDKINVYIAGNLLTVENTWAAAKTVKVFFIGT